MSHSNGSLFLVPNVLDFGASGPLDPVSDVLPMSVLRVASRLTHWIAENAKTTRAFLKRIDEVMPLVQPLQTLSISELPRPRKGPSGLPAPDLAALLAPAFGGHDLGLISEAGLPAVADPGAKLVEAAHTIGIEVIALAGPSSLMLALAASGLNGQSFAFVGYLPIDATERGSRIHELETLSRRTAQTQLMIETPYRNGALLAALLAHLQPGTRVAVSCGLTMSNGFSRTDSVRDWKSRPASLPNDIPAVFSLLGG